MQPKLKRLEILQQILDARVSAIIRTRSEEIARQAMQAAVDGGFRMIEFTLTTPGAMTLIEEFSGKSAGSTGTILVGAGTVLTPQQAQRSVAAGATFLVSPITDRAIIDEAHRLDVPIIPGAFTPTEMQNAHLMGADIVKVFPAVPGGPAYMEAVLAPLPHLRLFPTTGITPENFAEYLHAGCVGVGFVKNLFPPEDLGAKDFASIRRRAEGISAALRQIR